MAEHYPLVYSIEATPVLICTSGAVAGYTLRYAPVVEPYQDELGGETDPVEKKVFLGRDKVVFAFRSTAKLVEFLRSGAPNDLAATDDWNPHDLDDASLEDIGVTYAKNDAEMEVCRLDRVADMLRAIRDTDLDGKEYGSPYVPIVTPGCPMAPVKEFLGTHWIARELADYAGRTELVNALTPPAPLGRFQRSLSRFKYTKHGNRDLPSSYDLPALANLWSDMAPQIASLVRFRD